MVDRLASRRPPARYRRGLTRREPDGSTVAHADLSVLGVTAFNEIVVDGRGNVYVNGGSDFDPGEGKAPGIIALVTPDGSVRQVADGIAFPNGMTVTPDNSTLVVAESFAARLTAFDIAADGSLSNRRAWADGVGPDGICIDADGAIWTGVAPFDRQRRRPRPRRRRGARARQARRALLRVHARRRGPADAVHADGRVAHGRGFEDNIARLTTGPRTGRLLTAPAPAAGDG